MNNHTNRNNHTRKTTPGDDPYRVEATSDSRACSSMDCTGLIPALPQSEAELEFYEELYPYITYPVKDEDSYT